MFSGWFEKSLQQMGTIRFENLLFAYRHEHQVSTSQKYVKTKEQKQKQKTKTNKSINFIHRLPSLPHGSIASQPGKTVLTWW